MSIRDNIAYGDNSRNDISIEEIIEVAKQANIHDFIIKKLSNCRNTKQIVVQRKLK